MPVGQRIEVRVGVHHPAGFLRATQVFLASGIEPHGAEAIILLASRENREFSEHRDAHPCGPSSRTSDGLCSFRVC